MQSVVCPACRTPLSRPADTKRVESSATCPSCGKAVFWASSSEFEADLQTTMDRSIPLSAVEHAKPCPPLEQKAVGRYQLLRALGHGGFGVVYLARDEVLGREVAIKIPRRDQFGSDSRFEQFVREARMAAQLRHPGIVTVHDIGQIEDGTYYIVLEFLPGGTLREMLEQQRLPIAQALQLFVQVADAVAYANAQGLIHRDLKPSNILLDGNGRPFVADFGLAIFGSAPQLPLVSIVGTPAYMAPEQIRGETHRLDRRTDVWGLGVILYVMLTGRLPFISTEHDVFAAIQNDDPPRPSDCNPSVPKEIERICLKCLSKRMTDRYDTASDLSAELRDWMLAYTPIGNEDPNPTVKLATKIFDSKQKRANLHERSTLFELQVTPKGLRFFTEQDAHFFLDLLPGVLGRDGLPESIRFWKQAFESQEPSGCFTVGVLFGPSGCGKTSFLKAGVLPRLASSVVPIYFEATSDDWEPRLVAVLRRRFPTLPASDSLAELLALLRDQEYLAPDKKLVLILDQFEQWLHQGRRQGDLTRALRQCDGVRVQCLLSVRDDFGMALTRFLTDLEVPLVQGHNFGTVDRFDLRHARNVLAAFGRAFGQLPSNAAPSPTQDRFLDQAVRELAEEDRVIPVRLSLFAEMIKNSAWTPDTLRRVGGAEGLGVTFLEETFSSRSGNPVYQQHADAVRRALQEFLPEHGGNIRGGRVSRERLISVVNYENRPEDFQTLLRVLAHEVRLITPADPENDRSMQAKSGSGETGSKAADRNVADRNIAESRESSAEDEAKAPKSHDFGYERLPSESSWGSRDSSQSSRRVASAESYQLTHDYLVPAIRNWLTRGQRATRRGRAELCLAERAAQWQSHPEPRFLPSFMEWLSIAAFTSHRDRTAPQRHMVHAATKYYGGRLLGISAVILLLVAGMIHYDRRGRDLTNRAVGARTLRSLLTADTEEVPRIIDELAPYREYVVGSLQTISADKSAIFRHRLHATLALLPSDDSENSSGPMISLDQLSERMVTLIPETSAAQLDAIAASFSDGLAALGTDFPAACWQIVLNERESPSRRLRFACLLTGNPDDERWKRMAEPIVRQMCLENPVHLFHWIAALKPVAKALTPPAREIFTDRSSSSNQRVLAASILATYLANDAEKLVELIRIAEPDQFALLLEPLRAHRTASDLLQKALEEQFEPAWPDPSAIDRSKWQEPDSSVRSALEAAHGLCHPSFAYCQTLPLDQFDSIAAKLRAAGYRPNCFRPYRTPTGTRVAAAWERDGKDWQISHGRTAEELRADDRQFREQGYMPVDVTEETGGDASSEFRFAGLWVQDPPGVAEAQMYVYVPESEHQNYWEPLNTNRFVPKTNVMNRPASDQPHYSSVRWRMHGVLEYLDNWDADAEQLSKGGDCEWPLADLRMATMPAQRAPSLSAVWWDGGGRQSKSLVNHPIDLHATACRKLVEQGWRPAALSAASTSPNNRILATSVWQRPLSSQQDLDEHARRQANVAVALLAINDTQSQPVFANWRHPEKSQKDGSKTSTRGATSTSVAMDKVWPMLCGNQQARARAWLIENLTPLLGDPTKILLDRLSQETDPNARAGILLALIPSAERGLLAPAKAELVARLASQYPDTPQASERSAILALLHALQAADQVLDSESPVSKREPSPDRNWFTTGAGNTMVVVRGPVELGVGAGGDDLDRESYFETRHRVAIPRTFAISATEVTVAEYLRFEADHSFARDYCGADNCPIIQVNILDAMRYCRWLGEQDGIPEPQQCYPPIDQITESMRLPTDWLDRTGYRLPTEAEWECACRAGTDTPRPFGGSDLLLGRYAFTAQNSKYHAWPVASRLPNAWGLFDMLGNVGEITMANYEPYPKPSASAVHDAGVFTVPAEPVWRGGAFLYQPADARSSHRSRFTRFDRTEVSVGFRIARTVK